MNSPTADSAALLVPTVLVVDDDPAVLDALSMLLTPRLEPLYRVEVVASAEEGLELLDRDEDDQQLVLAAVISDEKMPGKTGVELLIALRDREEHRGGGRMIITGYAGLESAKRAINEAEVEKYLPKPWDDGELLDALGEILQSFEKSRGWDACDVLTLEDFAVVRDELYTVRREETAFLELRFDDDEQAIDVESEGDEESTFLVLWRWSAKGKEIEAFLRLRDEGSGPVVIDECSMLPHRDDPATRGWLAAAAQVAFAGREVKTDGVDLHDASDAPLRSTMTERWKLDQTLCRCHQSSCLQRDFARASRDYHCPFDRLSGRVPTGFPVDGAGD